MDDKEELLDKLLNEEESVLLREISGDREDIEILKDLIDYQE